MKRRRLVRTVVDLEHWEEKKAADTAMWKMADEKAKAKRFAAQLEQEEQNRKDEKNESTRAGRTGSR
jgi:hypothetical protein